MVNLGNNNLSVRSFLFLQGPNSKFFYDLAKVLESLNAKTMRVNFNGGDLFFWHRGNYINYTDKLSNWPEFLIDLQGKNNFTDIILFGDTRHYHKMAIDIFKSLFPKVQVHVFEEGYIRPYWVTHELGGVNRNTAIPKEPSFYEAINPQEKYNFIKLRPSFRFMIVWSFLYYMFTPACSNIFKNYVSHRPTSSALDARYWLKRLFRYKLNNIEAEKLQKKIKREDKSYFLVPLQLWSDSQIQINSPFRDLEDFINYTIENFAKFAPLNTVLIFKNHPQDNGIFNLRKRVYATAEMFKVSSRVYFIDGGTIPQLIKPSIGVVLVNSTTGLQAINHGKPTICLGDSFYDIEGLTNHSALELFWHNPIPPDLKLYKKFYDYLINNIQINGSFYSPDGVSLLVRNTAEKLATYKKLTNT